MPDEPTIRIVKDARKPKEEKPAPENVIVPVGTDDDTDVDLDLSFDDWLPRNPPAGK